MLTQVFERTGRFAAVVLLGGLISGAAVAAPIVGVLNISGGVSVNGTTIDFLPPPDMGFGTTAADATTNTGSFAVLNTGDPAHPATGSILDLGGGPVVGAFNLPNFISGFALAPNIRLDLTFINPGIYSAAECSANTALAAAGNVCTPPGSPFNLADVTSGGSLSAVISLGLAGNAVNTTTGETTSFTGTLSTQVDHTSYEAILATLASGGSFETSYSGSFTAVVPEPGTMSMIFTGLGMLGVGLAFKRVKVTR